MHKLVLPIALIAVIGTQPVLAGGFYTGNEIYEVCTSGSSGLCSGYIAGAFDALQLDYEVIICPPAGFTLGQLRDVVVKGMQDYPESRHLRASDLILATLSLTWPCPPSQ